MTRKTVIDPTEFTGGTMTAEQLEAMMAEQLKEQQEFEEQVNESINQQYLAEQQKEEPKQEEPMKNKNQCACTREVAEMDMFNCIVCSELCCVYCCVEDEDGDLLCPDCFKKEVESGTTTECSCGMLIEKEDMMHCEGCKMSLCDGCAKSHPENKKPLCEACHYNVLADMETDKELEAQKEKKEEERKEKSNGMFARVAKDIKAKREMNKMTSIEKILREAHANKMSKYNLDNGLTIAPQEPTTSSVFGICVKEKVLQNKHVYWAFRTIQEGESTRRQWLAVLCDTGKGSGVYMDLSTPEGRKKQIELSSKLVTVLKKRRLWKRVYNNIFKSKK